MEIELKFKFVIIVTISLFALSACAKGGCPSKDAAISSVKKIMPVKFEILSLSESKEMPGLCEVATKIDREPVIFYIDKTGEYIFSGSIVSTKDKSNITQKRQEFFKTKM